MEKEKELKAFLLGEARKDLQIAYDNWKINLGNIDAKNKYYEAAKKVVEIEGMDSRRLMSQTTGVIEQQAQRARDLADAFTEVESGSSKLKTELDLLKKELETTDSADQNYIKTLNIKINRLEALIEKLKTVPELTPITKIEDLNPLPQNNKPKSKA
jgi:predicted RNase H-like nuclease (RuvC/YqgF family)